MPRTKGALNRKTRAALHAVKEGQLDANGLSMPVRYLLGIVRNHKKPESLRIEAAKHVAPLQPKLSSVDLHQNPQPPQTEEELKAQLVALIEADPALASVLIGMVRPGALPDAVTEARADPDIARELGIAVPGARTDSTEPLH